MNLRNYLLAFLLFNQYALADLILTLEQAQNIAQNNSLKFQSLTLEKQAQEKSTNSLSALVYPKLSLEATYKYQTEVSNPQLSSKQKDEYKNHTTYSIGPTINFTLLDFGASNALIEGAKSLVQSKEYELINQTKTIKLTTTLHYLNLELATQQLQLVADALALAQSQARDIEKKYRAGSVSRLEYVVAQKEIIAYRIKFQDAQQALGVGIHDLNSYLHGEMNLTFQSPGIGSIDPIKLDLPAFDYKIEIDPLEKLESNLTKHNSESFAGNLHPAYNQIFYQKSALLKQASSSKSNQYPKLVLSGRSSYDFPNGLSPKEVQQNYLLLNFSMPLFENSKSIYDFEEKQLRAQALEKMAEQTLHDMHNSFQKITTEIFSLTQQDKLLLASINQSEVVAKLSRDSYNAGRLPLVDLQNANLKVLEAKVLLAKNKIRLLMKLAEKQYLSI